MACLSLWTIVSIVLFLLNQCVLGRASAIYLGQRIDTLPRLAQSWRSFFFFIQILIGNDQMSQGRPIWIISIFFFQVHWLERYFLLLLWLCIVRILKFKTRKKKVKSLFGHLDSALSEVTLTLLYFLN